MSLQPHLWNVMAAAAGDEGRFRELLMSATEEQMILLRQRFDEAAARLRCGHADRIVTSGRKAYDEALESSPVVEPPDDAVDFRGVFERVYRERFGGAMPREEPENAQLGYEPSWEEELWELIEVVNVGVPLEDAASNYTRSELILLDAAARMIVERIESEIVMKTGREIASTWIDVGDWMLGKGRDQVSHWLQHPEAVPAEIPPNEPVFVGALENLYIDRYGASMPLISRHAEIGYDATRMGGMTGPLQPDELAQLTSALRGGAMTSTRALLPYLDDGLRMWAVLRQVLAADVDDADVVARAGLFLRASERGAFAREMFDDVRPEVRAALLAAWTPVDVSAPGKVLPTVPDAELDELLRRGLVDESDDVRAAAAKLAYAANRGGSLVAELAINLESADRSVRWWSTLALGGAEDVLSLELLRQEAGVDHAGRVAAAVRALGARADGKHLWWRALEDSREEVRAAALHALATVVVGLDAEEIEEIGGDPRADVQGALAAYQQRDR